MIFALVVVLVVVGSVVFHLVSPWWWTPIASNWGRIDDMLTITFWVTGAGFVAVLLFMAYCLVRFRHQEGRRSAYEPENQKLEAWLAGVTTIAVLILLAPGLLVWGQFITVPKDAMEVEAVGVQWQWSFRFPGADNKLGSTDPRFVDSTNPMGLNPADPSGQDDLLVTSGDMHLPHGKPVKVLLRSLDVLHDFYVPEFRAKMDLIPGMVTYFWFTPTRNGEFEILCAAFCGVGHAHMRGKVVIEPDGDYQTWLSSQTSFAQSRKSEATHDKRASVE